MNELYLAMLVVIILGSLLSVSIWRWTHDNEPNEIKVARDTRTVAFEGLDKIINTGYADQYNYIPYHVPPPKRKRVRMPTQLARMYSTSFYAPSDDDLACEYCGKVNRDDKRDKCEACGAPLYD
jgi:hypothetical protein